MVDYNVPHTHIMVDYNVRHIMVDYNVRHIMVGVLDAGALGTAAAAWPARSHRPHPWITWMRGPTHAHGSCSGAATQL
eukprot:SAG31_NODE_898_length_11146_cov_25.421472_4_plen_78_part_00